jgi:hypothetical protein
VALRNPGSLSLTGFVIARVRRADEGIGTGLNRGRKFPEVLTDLAQVTEKLINIFRIDFEGLVKARADVGHIGQGAAKFDDGLADIRAVLSDHRIDMIQGLVRFL